MSNPIEFAEEPAAEPAAELRAWEVLVVDDDPEVHAVTRLMLNDFQFEGRTAALLHAHSTIEARRLLSEHPDIALVLLDVVMETDRSGLDLVRHIRDELGNTCIRIAMRTGQPGLAPEHQIVSQYSIDDYVLKSDLTYLRVQTLVTSALRTFALLRTLGKTEAELKRANAELERLALTDPLTGLWNRRHFNIEIEREWRRTLRERIPAAALMFDVDNFKLYNDSQGHPAGDKVLQQIAKVLADTFRRAGDTVCRYGGEEFAVIFPRETAGAVEAALNAAREEIAS
ncbi:MAG: diguanylate cyclase, partial [Hydrocarboniphaga effusa]|nr:diguanylate cyclase [Hydrocarboniphaga effusa]